MEIAERKKGKRLPAKGPLVCTRCGVTKPREEFHDNQGRPRSQCKLCTGERVRDWADANPEKVKAKARAGALRRKYGLTVEEYESLLEGQGGACALCGVKPEGRRLLVDHDHETNRVRGLLCTRCNSALAQFGDTVDGLQRAVEYVQPQRRLKVA